MSGTSVLDARVKELGKASRRAAGLSFLGFLLVAGAIGYAVVQLRSLERERIRLEQELRQLEQEVGRLRETRVGLLTFLGDVASRERIAIMHSSVDGRMWDSTARRLEQLPDGRRKRAVYSAILLAWKEVPFTMSGSRLDQGVNSPQFFVRLLSRVGVNIPVTDGQTQSEALVRASTRVDSPLPGDLLLYRGTEPGSVGRFVVMYLGPGRAGGHGICLGALDRRHPLQVLDSYWLDHEPPVDEFLGYYRPKYD